MEQSKPPAKKGTNSIGGEKKISFFSSAKHQEGILQSLSTCKKGRDEEHAASFRRFFNNFGRDQHQ